MKTKDLDKTQLCEYFSEHVRYEVKLLFNATWAISKQLQVPQGLENMIVESYVIHLRNLIGFLYPATFRDSDVCAKDFFLGDGDWEAIRPDMSQILQAAKKRADQEVGHLTTSRKTGTPKSKEWDVAGLTEEIVPIIEIFCKSADRVDLKEYSEELFITYAKIRPYLV